MVSFIERDLVVRIGFWDRQDKFLVKAIYLFLIYVLGFTMAFLIFQNGVKKGIIFQNI